jgi:hypothetical protein
MIEMLLPIPAIGAYASMLLSYHVQRMALVPRAASGRELKYRLKEAEFAAKKSHNRPKEF